LIILEALTDFMDLFLCAFISGISLHKLWLESLNLSVEEAEGAWVGDL